MIRSNVLDLPIDYDEVTDVSESLTETVLTRYPNTEAKQGRNITSGISGPEPEVEPEAEIAWEGVGKKREEMSGDDLDPNEMDEELTGYREEEHSTADSIGKDVSLKPRASLGEDDDEDEEEPTILPEGAYKASDYERLDVSDEVRELFGFIGRYTPQSLEMDHKLRPYVPDYIPAVGDIDAFIKVGRPDGETSTLGLTVLDEPSAKQSDATVLDLQLRAVARHSTARSVVVKTVSDADKNVKVVEKWMRDISDLHRAKPPPAVHYAKRMPEIDSLMQEWPPEVEALLKDINLPSADFDIELQHYVDIICGILDIPIYKSRIQSLHVLFTLFSVFKNSSHFGRLAAENIMDNTAALNQDDVGEGAERMVL